MQIKKALFFATECFDLNLRIGLSETGLLKDRSLYLNISQFTTDFFICKLPHP